MNKKKELIEVLIMSIAAISVIVSIFIILLEDNTYRIDEYSVAIITICITLITGVYLLLFLRRTSPKKYIFISYALQDFDIIKDHTELLLEILMKSKRYRYEVIDSKSAVSYGEKINDGIKKAIEKSDIILLFISDTYLKSFETQKEYILAKETEKIVIPILLEESINMAPFPKELEEIKCVELYKNLGVTEKSENIYKLGYDLLKNRFD